MQKVRFRFVMGVVALVLCLGVCCGGRVWAGWFGPDTLVTIDGKKYTTKDFENWWENWKEKGMKVPEDPEPFIDWLLLVREAERMHLYEDPEFRHKIMTFLKVRGLLLLKRDEVDSKINITEEQVRRRYQEKYVPRWHITIYYFKDKEKAESFYDKVTKGELIPSKTDPKELEAYGLIQVQRKWLRPLGLTPEWKNRLSQLKSGSYSKPFKWEKLYALIHMEQVKGGDDHDFKRVARRIRRELRKAEEARLTTELINRLKKKYHVKVHQDRIMAIKMGDNDTNCTNEPVIETDKGIVTDCEFRRQIDKLKGFNKKYGFKSEDDALVKSRILNGILGETLTSWEAIDRHYEKRPPLKAVYQFYRGHRLIKALEKKLFLPQIKITDQEMQKYYKEHIGDYTRPEIVKIAIVDGNETQIKRFWTDVITGKDFFIEAKKIRPQGAVVQDVPFNHLEATTKKVVQGLSKGDISDPVDIKGHLAVIKLLERRPATPLPLDKVKGQIRERLLHEKLAQLKRDFLSKIKAKSEIKIDQKAWKDLRDRMVRNDERQGK